MLKTRDGNFSCVNINPNLYQEILNSNFLFILFTQNLSLYKVKIYIQILCANSESLINEPLDLVAPLISYKIRPVVIMNFQMLRLSKRRIMAFFHLKNTVVLIVCLATIKKRVMKLIHRHNKWIFSLHVPKTLKIYSIKKAANISKQEIIVLLNMDETLII